MLDQLTFGDPQKDLRVTAVDEDHAPILVSIELVTGNEVMYNSLIHTMPYFVVVCCCLYRICLYWFILGGCLLLFTIDVCLSMFIVCVIGGCLYMFILQRLFLCLLLIAINFIFVYC